MTSVEIADLDIKDIVKEVNPYTKRKKAYILLDRKFAEDPVDGSYLKWHFDKKICSPTLHHRRTWEI